MVRASLRGVTADPLVAAAVATALALASLVAASNGGGLDYRQVYVADVSTPVSLESFQCLKRGGGDIPVEMSSVIVRAWRSIGDADKNAPTTLWHALEADMLGMDVYMFPCVKCGNLTGQVESMLQSLNCTIFGRVWLDIEGAQYWHADRDENVKAINELGAAAKKLVGYNRVGVYSSHHSWTSIFPEGFVFPWADDMPLWYPHYDNKTTMDDFVVFGGWEKPVMKQFVPSVSTCGAVLDISVAYVGP